MKVGQKVKARFVSLPRDNIGNERSFDKTHPVREGVVTYIHPKGRYVTVTIDTGFGLVSESFAPMEINKAMEEKYGKSVDTRKRTTSKIT